MNIDVSMKVQTICTNGIILVLGPFFFRFKHYSCKTTMSNARPKTIIFIDLKSNTILVTESLDEKLFPWIRNK